MVATNPQLVARVRELKSRWERQELTLDQKNQVGIAFVANVLGLDREVAEAFVQGDPTAHSRVNDAFASQSYDVNCQGQAFWQEIDRIFPNLHTEEDLEFLLREDKGKTPWQAAWQFLWAIDPFEESLVIARLNVLAHIHK